MSQRAARLAISQDGGKTFPNKDIVVASLATDNPFDDPLPGASFFGRRGCLLRRVLDAVHGWRRHVERAP